MSSETQHHKGGSFLGILKRLSTNNDPVTIIIRSGSNCCRHTGCLLNVTNEFVVLVSNANACSRTYIPIDCICAVIDPAENNG